MKKLYRSRKQRMIAGICGGFAEYFNIDVTIMRVIFALLFFFGGFIIPIILYGALYFIIPEWDSWE